MNLTCSGFPRKNWKKRQSNLDYIKNAGRHIVPGGFASEELKAKSWPPTTPVKTNFYLGLCLGMQIMSIEFARNILKDKQIPKNLMKLANWTNPNTLFTSYPDNPGTRQRRYAASGILSLQNNQRHKTYSFYGKNLIEERHRHRYEFNNDYKKSWKNGMIFSGIYEKANLVEIAEIKNHPFMIGSQFHPE